MVCKCAVSLLTGSSVEEGGGVEGGGVAGEGAAGAVEDDAKGDVRDGGLAFPLDIDQEVSAALLVVCSMMLVRLARALSKANLSCHSPLFEQTHLHVRRTCAAAQTSASSSFRLLRCAHHTCVEHCLNSSINTVTIVGLHPRVGSAGHPYQQMQLMREMYRLGELQAWEAMLPLTKQRLRDASQSVSLSRDDSRAFWCVVGRKNVQHLYVAVHKRVCARFPKRARWDGNDCVVGL